MYKSKQSLRFVDARGNKCDSTIIKFAHEIKKKTLLVDVTKKGKERNFISLSNLYPLLTRALFFFFFTESEISLNRKIVEQKGGIRIFFLAFF